MRNTSLRPQVSGLGGFRVLRGLGRIGFGLALMVGLSTCGSGHGTDCLKSTGTIVTQRRDVDAGLVTVTAFDNVDLRLVQDTQTYAEVRAGENLISDIVLTRKGNALEINNTSTCNWARSYDTPREVTLHVPRITNVFLRGQGNTSTVGQFVQDTIFFHLIGAGDMALNVKARQLYLDQYELGDMTIQGTAERMDFTLGGSGRLFAQGITPKVCYFTLTRDSDGDAHARASEALAGTVAGNGTLYYGGAPTVTDIKVTGNGSKKQE
ncbi:GIN domain-containing protein [Hymenobacter ruber]